MVWRLMLLGTFEYFHCYWNVRRICCESGRIQTFTFWYMVSTKFQFSSNHTRSKIQKNTMKHGVKVMHVERSTGSELSGFALPAFCIWQISCFKKIHFLAIYWHLKMGAKYHENAIFPASSKYSVKIMPVNILRAQKVKNEKCTMILKLASTWQFFNTSLCNWYRSVWR